MARRKRSMTAKEVKRRRHLCKDCGKVKTREKNARCRDCYDIAAANGKLSSDTRKHHEMAQVQEDYRPRPVSKNTTTQPGSADRIFEYAARFERGEELFCEQDATLEGRVGARVQNES